MEIRIRSTAYCKHAYALEQRLGPKARADRGLLIHRTGGQVERIASDHYLVKSQSTDRTYEVCDFGHGWMCSCADHMYKASVCKHIQAVEFDAGARRVIGRPDQTTCKFCDSLDIIRKGKRDGKQQYGCKACGKRFVRNLGFEGRHSLPELITSAVEMVYGGMSSRKTASELRQARCVVSHMTVQRWAKQYGELLESYMDAILPQVGEEWRTDEVYMKIRGERKYLFAMLDSETRYWIAKQVATHSPL